MKRKARIQIVERQAGSAPPRDRLDDLRNEA